MYTLLEKDYNWLKREKCKEILIFKNKCFIIIQKLNGVMNMKNTKKRNKTFEEIKRIDENNVEFWYARELMPVLEYSKWQNFEKIIDKAKMSCENSDIRVSEQFTDVSKMSKRANNAGIEIKDYKLTRYAC